MTQGAACEYRIEQSDSRENGNTEWFLKLFLRQVDVLRQNLKVNDHVVINKGRSFKQWVAFEGSSQNYWRVGGIGIM